MTLLNTQSIGDGSLFLSKICRKVTSHKHPWVGTLAGEVYSEPVQTWSFFLFF